MFCDTSYGAKLYLPEQDTDEVRAILEASDEVFVSELFRVEIMSIFHRLVRERLWSQSSFQSAVRQFRRDSDTGFWTCLPIDSQVIGVAERIYESLPKNIFLRAGDCIHLASALHYGMPDFYTFDAQQALAASAIGLKATCV